MIGLWLIVIFLMIISGFMGYAYWKENLAIEKVTLNIKSVKIRKKMTLLQISDLHLYCGMQVKRLEKICCAIRETIADYHPDIIFLTGDLIDDNTGIPVLENILTLLKAPSGIYAVFGNHDYFQYRFVHVFSPLFDFIDKKPADIARLKEILKRFHVKLLVDKTEQRIVCGNRMAVSGLDALTVKKKHWQQLKSFGKVSGFNILLSHYPDVIKHIPEGIDLVLSGHTHGGQITFFGLPIITRTGAGRKNIRGASVHGKTIMHVSKGMGVSRNVPFRFFAKPDLTVIRLEGKK